MGWTKEVFDGAGEGAAQCLDAHTELLGVSQSGNDEVKFKIKEATALGNWQASTEVGDGLSFGVQGALGHRVELKGNEERHITSK